MFRSKLVLASITAVFLACSQVQAGLIESHWNLSGSGLWNEPTNWNPSGVPDNTETDTYDVTIDAGGGYVEVGLTHNNIAQTNNYTINQLDCKNGRVEIESWEGWHRLILLEAYGLKNHGNCNLEIEEIEIIGDVTNLDGAILWLCDMDIEGNLTNQAGATIGIEYEVWVDSEDSPGTGNLQNNGTIEIHPMSEFGVEGSFDNSGKILIYGGQCGADEQVLENYGFIGGFGVLYGGQEEGESVQNYGEIIASGGSLVVVSEGSLMNSAGALLRNEPLSSLQIKPHLHDKSPADVNNYNYGRIEVNAGGGVAFDCNMVNESGGTIELRGGTLAAQNITHSAGATFYGFGTITTNELLLESGTDPELTGPTNIVGNLKVANGATLIISAGLTLITGHTTNNGTILLAGGTVIFQGGYSGGGEVIANAAPSSDVIIDNGDDGTSSTGSWGVSGASGYYGDNSLWSLGNGHTYSFEAWVLGGVRKISLWWTASPSRSDAVSVEIYDGGSLIDTVEVNQRNNGGKWNVLGYYTFSDKAKVNIISGGSGATIADAVKFERPSTDIIIDNGDDGTSSTGSWGVSGASGYYGDNSLWSSGNGDSYSFEARFLVDSEISLWWTASPSRSTNVSVEIYDGGTLLNTVTGINQTTDGGKWNVLVGGPYSFSYGAKVKIISPGSGATIADAVKFSPL